MAALANKPSVGWWEQVRAAGAVVRREFQLACRAPAFWATVAAGALLAVWRASVPGVTSALAAYQTRQVAVLGIAVLAILLGAAAAGRDRREATAELVLAKPGGSAPRLVVLRFLGVWLSVMAIAALMLAAASVRQIAAGTSWRPGAYLEAWWLSLVPLALATGLGFGLTVLLAHPLAGAVAAVYWVCVPLARGFMPYAADMTASQHWPAALLFAVGLLALAAARYASTIRGAGEGRARWGWAAGICFGGAVACSFSIALGGEDALVARDPVLSAIAAQRAQVGERAPGFWLPDARGRLVGLSDFAGRPAVLAFWAPGAPASADVLGALTALANRHREAGLGCLAVALDRDAAAGRAFAREHSGVVVLWDRGQHYGDGEQWSDTPLGMAYEVKQVPTVLLLDRQRRVVERLEGPFLSNLEAAVAKLVEP